MSSCCMVLSLTPRKIQVSSPKQAFGQAKLMFDFSLGVNIMTLA